MEIFQFRYDMLRGYHLYCETYQTIRPELEAVLYEKTFPAGERWFQKGFIGRSCLRSFVIQNELFAISRTTITDQTDKIGNKGILNADIFVLDYKEYLLWLSDELEKHSNKLSKNAQFLSFSLPFRIVIKRILDLNFFGPIHIILRRDPSEKEDLATEYLFLSLQYLAIKDSPTSFIEFSTLSLDWKDSVKFIAVPYTELSDVDARKSLIIS